MGGSFIERVNSLTEIESQIVKPKRKQIKKPIIKTRDRPIQIYLYKGNNQNRDLDRTGSSIITIVSILL